MNTLMSVKEAAAKLSCSGAAVWKWIQQRRLHKVKVGRLTRIKEQDIDAVIRLGLSPKALQPMGLRPVKSEAGVPS